MPKNPTLIGNHGPAIRALDPWVPSAGRMHQLLTDEERWDLIEYLKSIPEEAGRVTPFGGPANAQTGHGRWSQQ